MRYFTMFRFRKLWMILSNLRMVHAHPYQVPCGCLDVYAKYKIIPYSYGINSEIYKHKHKAPNPLALAVHVTRCHAKLRVFFPYVKSIPVG